MDFHGFLQVVFRAGSVYIYNHPIGKNAFVWGLHPIPPPTYHQNQQNSTSRPQFSPKDPMAGYKLFLMGEKMGKGDPMFLPVDAEFFRIVSFRPEVDVGGNLLSLGTSSKLCTWIIGIFAILCALDVVGWKD